MNTPNSWVIISKCNSPLKCFRAPWRKSTILQCNSSKINSEMKNVQNESGTFSCHQKERKLSKTNSTVPKEHKANVNKRLSWTNDGIIWSSKRIMNNEYNWFSNHLYIKSTCLIILNIKKWKSRKLLFDYHC